MNLDDLLVIDTETTGLRVMKDEIWDVAFVPIATDEHLTLRIKPDLPSGDWDLWARHNCLRSTSKSEEVSVNGARRQIFSFIQRHFDRVKPTLIGQNVGFDVKFLGKLFHPHYLDFIDPHSIDTFSWIEAGKLQGWIPDHVCGLGSACDFFGVTIADEHRHTALGDALATKELFRCLHNRISVYGK